VIEPITATTRATFSPRFVPKAILAGG